MKAIGDTIKNNTSIICIIKFLNINEKEKILKNEKAITDTSLPGEQQ